MIDVKNKRRASSAFSALCGATATLVVAAPALASDNVYDPSSYAFANTFGNNTTQVQTQIKNGVVGATYDQTAGSALATSASADGYFNMASVISNTGNSVIAKADLHAGTVKAVVTNGPSNVPRGFAEARIQDTVFFNNATDSAIYLPFKFGFDGRLTDPNDFGSTASAIFSISGALGQCPGGGFGTCFGDYSVHLQNGGFANQTTIIGYAANGLYNGVQQGGAFFFNAPDNVDLTNYTVFKDWNSGGGYYNTVVSSVLVLQPGATRLGFDLRLLVDSWVQPNTIADFGNTTLFGFGAVPTGLTFTSASGAFLTGGVPEPASWTLLIAGFGLTGATMRRRRIASVVA